MSAPAPGDACPFCALAACRAEAPRAERVHVAVFAEAVPHLHVHLVPRGPEVPPEDRGPGFLFDRAPRVSPERADALARAIVARLRTGS